MKRILLIGGMAWLCHTGSFAQNTSPAQFAKPSKTTANTTSQVVTPAAPTQTQAEKYEQAAAKTPQGQNNLRLGLPAAATKEQYAAAKERLYAENRTKYNELFKQGSQVSVQPRTISRNDYNKLSAEQQARVNAYPDRYKIVD